MGAKWLELLKEIAPRVTRAAVLRDPTIPQGIGQFGAIQSVAPSLGLEVSPVNLRDAGEIEHDVAAFARGSNGGLIVTGSGLAIIHRELIVALCFFAPASAFFANRIRLSMPPPQATFLGCAGQSKYPRHSRERAVTGDNDNYRHLSEAAAGGAVHGETTCHRFVGSFAGSSAPAGGIN